METLPSELREGVDAEALGGFEVHVLQRSADGLQIRGVDVQRPGEQVHHLSVRNPRQQKKHRTRWNHQVAQRAVLKVLLPRNEADPGLWRWMQNVVGSQVRVACARA